MSIFFSCSIVKIIFSIFVYCDRFSFFFQLLRSFKSHGIIIKLRGIVTFSIIKRYIYDLYKA